MKLSPKMLGHYSTIPQSLYPDWNPIGNFGECIGFDRLTATLLVNQIACLQTQEAYPSEGGDGLS
jgi:hypothetical protein